MFWLLLCLANASDMDILQKYLAPRWKLVFANSHVPHKINMENGMIITLPQLHHTRYGTKYYDRQNKNNWNEDSYYKDYHVAKCIPAYWVVCKNEVYAFQYEPCFINAEPECF